MSIDVNRLRIVHYPDPVLRAPTQVVDPADPLVHAVIARMIELMHEERGVGLAAPQVGLSWRLFVANPDGEPEGGIPYLNPVLKNPDEELEAQPEGCLSIPDVTVHMRRPKAITITAQNIQGESFEQTADGLAARVWQHEYDHLMGVLIIDKMNVMDKMANRRTIQSLEDTSRG